MAAEYWLGLFTGHSWQQFLAAEELEIGFNINKLKSAQKMKVGDYVIAYVTKLSRFIAILKVVKPAKVSTKDKWTEGLFPVRVAVAMEIYVDLADAPSIKEFTGNISFLKNDNSLAAGKWSAYVRSSPLRWNPEDGRTIRLALEQILSGHYKRPIIPEQRLPKVARKPQKPQKLNRVGKLNKRSKVFSNQVLTNSLNGRVLSKNQVTGYSVNFPIQATCRPTEVCRDTCYFAIKLNAFDNALMMQHRNLQYCRQDPEGFARQISVEYNNAGINFLRWNGGGDLFDEALIAIETLRLERPDIVLWIVSRKPELAAKIRPHSNHYLHLSFDRSSISQKEKIIEGFKGHNVFASYQTHPSEVLIEDVVKKVDLIFMHDYEAPPVNLEANSQKFCPLNGAEAITGMCDQCRKCFDGTLI